MANEWKVLDRKESKLVGNKPKSSLSKVKLIVLPQQKRGDGCQGYVLGGKLSLYPTLNDKDLDWLMKNKKKIPKEWKYDEEGDYRIICFFGAKFVSEEAHVYIRILYWKSDEDGWVSDYLWLEEMFDKQYWTPILE